MRNRIISLLIILIGMFSYGQKLEVRGITYYQGNLSWGAFDANTGQMKTEWEKHATLNKIQKVYDENRVYSYILEGYDTSGREFKMNLNGDVTSKEDYFDDNHIKYTVSDKGGDIYILCYKPLPKGENFFMAMKITDIH